MRARPKTKVDLEAQRARTETDYRKSPLEAIEAAERADLLQRYEELGERIDALQKKLDAMGDPGWKVALRVGALLSLWGGLVWLGAHFAGLWGALSGLAAPVAAFFAVALIPCSWDKLIRRMQRPGAGPRGAGTARGAPGAPPR